jgi:hypothetical protein
MKLNIVPARTGLQWVKQGMRTFFKQPLAMTGLFFMFMAVMTVVSMLPYIGTALVLGLLPAATLGFMAATQETSKGKFPMPWILASALRAGRQEMRAILLLGALYATGFLLIMGLSTLVDGGQFARFYLGGGSLTHETLNQADFQGAMWVAMGLNLPLSLLFWHAPALVHWHGVPPLKALFFSFVACLRNLGAYIVFGLAWLGIFMLVMVLTNVGVNLAAGAEAAAVAMMPAAMLVMALFFTSLYFTFADSFIASSEESPKDESHDPT